MNPLMKKIMMSRWFVNFRGSHLSTDEEAAEALGGLIVDSKLRRERNVFRRLLENSFLCRIAR